jgi:TorA maturation chaperone TorD
VQAGQESAAARIGVAATIDPEDEQRGQLYRLLSRLLAAPADQALLDLTAGLKGDDTPLGRSIAALAARAGQTTPAAAADEYGDLFIGIGRGELVPYASYYLTGFLNEKPLARLRGEMARLGIARADGVKEPEDHIAALCEMMAGLIEGSFGDPAPLSTQRRFFDGHLAAWAPQFFADLEGARAAALYAPVGAIGQGFMAIEATAFTMCD